VTDADPGEGLSDVPGSDDANAAARAITRGWGCGPMVPPFMYAVLVLLLLIVGVASGGSTPSVASSTPRAHHEEPVAPSSSSTTSSSTTTTTSLPLFTPPGADSGQQPSSSGGGTPPANNSPSSTACSIPNTLSYTVNGSTTNVSGGGSDQSREWSIPTIQDATSMHVSISGLVPHTQCGMEYHMYVSGNNGSYALQCGGGPTLAADVNVTAPEEFSAQIKVVANC
jgi:hypothetical protein